jgi:TorA maturation chaperone TorD
MSASMDTSTVQFESPRAVTPEDQARANFYALIAHLFYRGPEEALLQAIAVAEPPEGALGTSWHALSAAASVMPADAAMEEFNEAFVGVGRPPLMLYGSYFLAGFMMEKPLSDLRNDLAELGFSRVAHVSEPEDHLSALCEVMRALILGDVERKRADIAVQQKFFLTHINPWIFRCMDEIKAYHHANLYKHVAAFAQTFFEIESEAFKM